MAQIARRTGVSYTVAYGLTRVQQRGFASYSEYRALLAKERGFSSHYEYVEDLLQQRGFSSDSQYREHLAQQKGFLSDSKYREHLSKQRCQQQRNRKVSALVNQRLRQLGRNQSWLARQLGVSRQAASLYVQGKLVPRGDRLGTLLDIICPDHTTRRNLEGLGE